GSRRASGRSGSARPGWSPGPEASGWLARTGTRPPCRGQWGGRLLRGALQSASPRVSRRYHHGTGAEGEVRPAFSSTLWGEDRQSGRTPHRKVRPAGPATDSLVKGLILAQNERWRRGLGMQVERVRSSDRASGARVSKATVTNPMVGHSRGKLRVIPSDVRVGHPVRTKAPAPWDGLSWY